MRCAARVVRRVSLALSLWLSVAVPCGRSHARADDVRIESDSAFQAYEVRSPGTSVFQTRRRLVTTAGFGWAHALADEPDDTGRTPRLTATVRLRLTQEFGDTCLVARALCVRATDPRDLAAFQPLARDTWIDVPTAYAEATGLPLGLEVRLGRQLHHDVMGMLRADAVRVRVEPWDTVALEALAGMLVRDTSLGGSPAFEPIGAPRLDVNVDPTRAPFIAAPITTPLVLAALELGRTPIVRARLAFREMRDLASADATGAHVEGGVLARRASLSLASQPLDALRLEADGVLDLLDTGPLTHRVIAARTGVSVRVSDAWRVAARVERQVPRFDPGSIWAYFVTAPIAEAQLDADWTANERLTFGAGLRGRRAELGGQDGEDVDLGTEGRARARFGPLGVGGSMFVWSGDLGPMAGVLLDGTLRVDRTLQLEARVSVWHFDDANRPDLYGTTVSEVVGARWQVGDATSALVELEHAASRVVGHRFRAVLALRVEAWR
jgi:hypothetical protein